MRRSLVALTCVGAVLSSAAMAQGPMVPSNPPQVGAGFSATPMTASGAFNVNSATLIHWRAAVARVLAGTGRGRLLIIGDSTSMGAGSGSGGTLNCNGAFVKAWPRSLAASLATRGIPTSDQSLFGSQSSPVAYGTYDTRANIGSWTNGVASYFTANAATTFAFTPTGQIDTIHVFYVKNGIFTVNFDGGATAFTSAAGGGLSYLDSGVISTTLGNHAINMAWSSGTAYFGAVLAYNSAVSAIDIMQRGWSGATVASFDPTQTNPYDGPNEIKLYAPDLTIINLTINDSNAGAVTQTYINNVQSLITAAQVSGDVLLMVGIPSNTANATNGILSGYQQALLGLAVQNNTAFLSIFQRWTSYAVTNPVMPYFDSLHATSVGYQDIGARAIADVLTSGVQ